MLGKQINPVLLVASLEFTRTYISYYISDDELADSNDEKLALVNSSWGEER